MDVPLVTAIRILPDGETPDQSAPADSAAKWIKTSRPVNPRGQKLWLWYRLDKTLREMSSAEKSQLITEIDVTYGDDKPWYGFERLERPVASPLEITNTQAVWLTVRKGIKRT